MEVMLFSAISEKQYSQRYKHRPQYEPPKSRWQDKSHDNDYANKEQHKADESPAGMSFSHTNPPLRQLSSTDNKPPGIFYDTT